MAPHHDRADPYVSLIIPVYNAEAYIQRSIDTAIQFFQRQDYPAEIIIVDDGSRDRTRAIVEPYGGHARILTGERNRGKGYAVRRGMQAATGRFLFFTDADLPCSLEPLPKFLRCLDREGRDVAIGWRNSPDHAGAVKASWLRKAGSALFTVLVSRIMVPGIDDTQCGLKGFRRAAAQALFSRNRINRFAFDVELIFIARKLGLQLGRVPVNVVASAPSTVRPAWDGLLAARDLARILCYDVLGYYA
ncbi:MAG: dolichyl-phosphate beta-glucosyltransferase [Nitrospirota bacterium]